MGHRMLPAQNSRGVPLMVVALLALMVCYGLTQPRIQFGEGHPYDAQSYYHMAQQVAAGQPVQELRPFASRIALPWLVGKLFPSDLMLGFTVLNLGFALGALILLGSYLRQFLRSDRLVLLLLILFVSNPASPLRFVFYLPAYTDPPALFFISLLLVLGRRIRRWDLQASLLLAGVGFTGALFRELVICGVLVAGFSHCARLVPGFPWLKVSSAKAVALALLPVAATLAGIAVANGVVESTGDYRYHVQMLGVVRQLFQQATIYPLAWLMAFGAVPLVLLVNLNRSLIAFLGSQQDVLLYLLGMALLAGVVGFHTDRLVFWAYPAVLVLFGKLIESQEWRDTDRLGKVLFFAPLVVAQILAQRALLPIPEDINGALLDPGAAPRLLLSVYGEGANLGQFYSSFMLPSDRVTLMVQYLALAAYFGLLRVTGVGALRTRSAQADR